MRRSRSFTVLIGWLAFASIANAYTVGEYMAALEGKNQALKEQQIYYFNGALDALMYANETVVPRAGGRKLVCFPTPIPGREALYKLFIDQVSLAVQIGGMQRTASAEVDQLIYASWMKAYPCAR